MATEACAICGGSEEEHKSPNIHHVFTTKEGDLQTPEQARKAEGRKSPQMVRVIQPQETPVSLQRLIEVLRGQKMLSDEEALYIAGFGDKPDYSHSGYRDPAM